MSAGRGEPKAWAPAGRLGLLGHLGLSALVTAPIALKPWDLIGDPRVDVWNHAWGPWWFAQSLMTGELPWRTRLLQWPAGGVLWFIDPLLAALGAPVAALAGPALAWNAVLFASVAFASAAAARFARAIGASPRAAWVASAALAGSAWVICELHNGISEAVHVGPVALALALVEEAAAAGTRRAWVKAGLGVALAAAASPYLGLGAGLAAIIRGIPHLRQAWAGGLVGGALSAAPALLLRAQLQAPDAIVKHPGEMNELLALHNGVDPRTFVAPLGFRSVDLSAEGFEHSMYLGLVALGLAGLGAAARGRPALPWVGAGLACAVAALGPWLFWDGDWLRLADGRRLQLPWAALQGLMPGLAMTHPLRLAVPTLVLVAAFAARGAEARVPARWLPGVVLVVLLDGLLLSGAPWPVATSPFHPPAAYAAMARGPHDPVEDAILDLPTDAGATMGTSRYLLYQSFHGRPVPYGPDARASTSALLPVPAFRRLAALCRRRPDEDRRLQLGRAGGDTRLVGLRRKGVRWIVLHHDIDPEVAPALEAEIAGELGPGSRDGTVTWWDLGAAR